MRSIAPRIATIDREKVRALDDETVGWHDKAIPPSFWGRTVADVQLERPPLSRLPTPLLTASEPALAANIATMASWAEQRGMALAPHGKTTMAPALWERQLAAGAWAVSLAGLAQVAVARAFGVSRIVVANAVISPLGLRWLANELAADAALEVFAWVDSVHAVAIMEDALHGHALQHPEIRFRPFDVLVELGGPGGRTGARDLGTAMEVARAVAASTTLRLAGVAGYEGALAHGADASSLGTVRAYLGELAALHARIGGAGLYRADEAPVVTAGGSTYFDVVADVLTPLVADGARVVLRPGAYVAHDDGFYRQVSPLGAHARTSGPRLVPAIHSWVRITSQPEAGLALFDAGKRDLPFDEGLPEPQLVRPGTADRREPRVLVGGSVSALNDQHGFLRFPTDRPAPVRVGDELRLGLSHPCTAFDKWGLIPVIDDPDANDPRVVKLLRTFF